MSALSSAQEPLAVVAHAGGVNEQAETPEEEEWKVSNCTLFFDLVYVVIIHVISSPLEEGDDLFPWVWIRVFLMTLTI